MFNDGKVTVSLFLPKTSKEVVLTENGKILDKYCTSLKGEQDLTGNFRLTGNFINKDNIFKIINEGAILKVRNEYDEDEIFRITTITPTPFLISIIAFQITITDTKTLWLTDVRPTNQNGLSAIQYMYDKSDSMGFSKEIKLNSDIMTTNTAYYQLMTLHDALFTADQSFINRWGGEVYRHQYNLEINKHIGNDNGVTIRENKNLTGFEGNKSTDDLCTVAIGKGYDGILGDYIESPLKDKYDRAYVKVIEYSDVKVRTESDTEETDDNSMLFDTLEEAKAELNKRIKNEFKNNKIDEIQATYDINFIDLSKTDKYKDYLQAERLFLGDSLNVIVPSLGITLKTRVISKEIDYLQNRVTKMTVSNVPVNVEKTDSQIVGSIRDMLKKNNNINLGEYVNTVIKGGLKNSNVIVRQNELLIMDTDNPKTCKRLWRLNLNGGAYSKTGYNGNYEYGFTMDGVFNASMIQTGILSTILIQNSDGSFQIDLSGTGGAKYFTNKNLAMEMKGHSLLFYNYAKYGDYIGELGSFINSSNSAAEIGLVHDFDSAIAIIYPNKSSSTGYSSYVKFDKYNVMGNKAQAPIKVYEDIEMNKTTIYNARLKSDNIQEISINGEVIAYLTNDVMVVRKNLQVLGNKNCIQQTKNYGEVPFYSNEDINSLLTKTPIDEVHKTTLQENGTYKCIIKINDLIKECINTTESYNVWISKLGFGDYKITTYPGYFVVESDREMEFKYKLEGKRKGFEDRNEKLIC